jgi:hypothetical protein
MDEARGNAEDGGEFLAGSDAGTNQVLSKPGSSNSRNDGCADGKFFHASSPRRPRGRKMAQKAGQRAINTSKHRISSAGRSKRQIHKT